LLQWTAPHRVDVSMITPPRATRFPYAARLLANG
jgi:hypothetical protein